MTPLALDTSVAVPLLVQSHSAHAAVVRWWDRRTVVLRGHAPEPRPSRAASNLITGRSAYRGAAGAPDRAPESRWR